MWTKLTAALPYLTGHWSKILKVLSWAVAGVATYFISSRLDASTEDEAFDTLQNNFRAVLDKLESNPVMEGMNKFFATHPATVSYQANVLSFLNTVEQLLRRGVDLDNDAGGQAEMLSICNQLAERMNGFMAWAQQNPGAMPLIRAIGLDDLVRETIAATPTTADDAVLEDIEDTSDMINIRELEENDSYLATVASVCRCDGANAAALIFAFRHCFLGDTTLAEVARGTLKPRFESRR